MSQFVVSIKTCMGMNNSGTVLKKNESLDEQIKNVFGWETFYENEKFQLPIEDRSILEKLLLIKNIYKRNDSSFRMFDQEIRDSVSLLNEKKSGHMKLF